MVGRSIPVLAMLGVGMLALAGAALAGSRPLRPVAGDSDGGLVLESVVLGGGCRPTGLVWGGGQRTPNPPPPAGVIWEGLALPLPTRFLWQNHKPELAPPVARPRGTRWLEYAVWSIWREQF